jgi:hypothetical protein
MQRLTALLKVALVLVASLFFCVLPAGAFTRAELAGLSADHNGVLCYPGTPIVTSTRVKPAELGTLEFTTEEGRYKLLDGCIVNKGAAPDSVQKSLARRRHDAALACFIGEQPLVLTKTLGDVQAIENGPALEFIPAEDDPRGMWLKGQLVLAARIRCRVAPSMSALEKMLPQ